MTFDIEKLPNKRRAEIYRSEYSRWKTQQLDYEGYFPIFMSLMDRHLLRNISGNGIRLYVYLGLHSKNRTGDCWLSIDAIAKYFDKSRRTISGWLKELEEAELITRLQMEKDGVAFTFLRPY